MWKLPVALSLVVISTPARTETEHLGVQYTLPAGFSQDFGWKECKPVHQNALNKDSQCRVTRVRILWDVVERRRAAMGRTSPQSISDGTMGDPAVARR